VASWTSAKRDDAAMRETPRGAGLKAKLTRLHNVYSYRAPPVIIVYRASVRRRHADSVRGERSARVGEAGRHPVGGAGVSLDARRPARVGGPRAGRCRAASWRSRARGRPTVALAADDLLAALVLGQTSSSTRCASSFDDLATTRPRQVTVSLRRTSAAKRTPSFFTRPAPAQSVTACATKPIESMPWANHAAHARRLRELVILVDRL